MIDEKWLDEHDLTYVFRMGGCDDEEAEELTRLIRLGIWAEAHAIPALDRISNKLKYCDRLNIYNARQALPADTGGKA